MKEKSPLPKSANPISSVNTRDELAKIAGVGHDTYNKGKKILDSSNDEIKQKVISGEMKINTAYNELFPKASIENESISEDIEPAKQEIKVVKKTKLCIKCNEEKIADSFYLGHDKCKECEEPKESISTSKGEVFKDIFVSPLSHIVTINGTIIRRN